MSPLILQITYLTGRCVATAYDDRGRAEWPPHPARVYSALVATAADLGRLEEPVMVATLEWLAALEAPAITASPAAERSAVPHFVPVNDTAVLKGFERERERIASLEADLLALQTATVDATETEKAKKSQAKAIAKLTKSLTKEREKLTTRIHRDHARDDDKEPAASALKAATQLLPERRGRQPRTFPSVTPEDPRVFLHWRADPQELATHLPALRELAAAVTRIGHTSSLVSCVITTSPENTPPPNYTPDAEGDDEILRVPGPGQLARLSAAYERHREIEPRVLPCRFQRYRAGDPQDDNRPPSTVFADEWVVFRITGGLRPTQTLAVAVARALRAALMRFCDDPPPELLSGHMTSGAPSERPHLAVVPLPFVGHPHATGQLLGVALVLPRKRDAAGAEAGRQALFHGLSRWEAQRRLDLDDPEVEAPPLELHLGARGTVVIERHVWGPAPLKLLRPQSWGGPSKFWATATPIALDRHPGDLHSRDPKIAADSWERAASSIALACIRIGLPQPRALELHPSVPIPGAAKARSYPAFTSGPDGLRRALVHARIDFEEPVRGPVLLGAGRYFGLGLCLPIHSTEEAPPAACKYDPKDRIARDG